MEAPPTTVDTAPVTGGVAPTRGRGGHMRGSYERGSYERGRGRGMGRGHFGGMGAPGGYPSRGGFVPRGGMGGPMMGYPGRGGFVPRGAPPMRGAPGMGGPGGYQGRGGAPRGCPPMRGTGRMPLYSQPPKQHTGVDNNKTVSPVQASVANQVVAGGEETTANSVVKTEQPQQQLADPNVETTVAAVAPIMAKPLSTGISPNYRGTGRGRGLGGIRGGRGSYNPHNGSAGMTSMYGAPHMGEHGIIRRGGPPRGRGQYASTGMTRPPLMQQPHIVNTQVAPQTSLKRGAPGGPPGPKRGRYDSSPYSQRAPAPKYQPHMAPPASYAVQHQPAQPPPPQSHHTYAQHDPSQSMDPYAQSYAAPQTPAPYNGYGQTTAYSHAAPAHTAHQTSSAYATHAATEYDQSQYQGYSSAYAQQDTRYQTYGQDYTQQYGAPAVDYSTSQADYSQHAQQSYDERAYAGYDTQSYQQSYTNSTGYY